MSSAAFWLKLLEVGHDEGADEPPPVAVDHRLVDVNVADQQAFQFAGGDVLAGRRDDQILLAVGDGKIAVGVEVTHVARVEPAVLFDRFGRRLGIPPVALHHVRPADQDFAVRGDLDFDAGNRRAHGADAVVVEPY